MNLTDQVSENAILLEPREVFDKGIVGITDDRNHVIYNYEELVAALTEDYHKENPECDAYADAIEWIDYNTIRSIDYTNKEYCPIIMHEVIK